MSEVSAVVLSIGESFTGRAIDSLAIQTIPIVKVVLVEHVSPFSRALNEGARQIETQYFVRVDADMILDATCAAELLAAMAPGVGIVVGELRDALAGRAVGIKLFRTRCFHQAAVPDSIASETEFGQALHRLGWRTVYLNDPVTGSSDLSPTVGEHRPDYTPAYTYRKLIVEGAKLRQRAARHGLFTRMADLEQSTHPVAVLAQLALGHGFFLPSTRDGLTPLAPDPRADWLTAVLESDRTAAGRAVHLVPLKQHARLQDVFHSFVDAGRALAEAEAGATLRALFEELKGTRRDSRALVAKVALGHGLLMDAGEVARLPADEIAFRRFMVYSLGGRSGFVDQLRARAAHAFGPARHARGYIPW